MKTIISYAALCLFYISFASTSFVKKEESSKAVASKNTISGYDKIHRARG
jgi:hypothetical protein